MNQFLPLKSIDLVVGLDQNGQPMAMKLVAGPLRTLRLLPGRILVVNSKHPVSGEERVSEYLLEKYICWEYVVDAPITVENSGVSAPVSQPEVQQ